MFTFLLALVFGIAPPPPASQLPAPAADAETGVAVTRMIGGAFHPRLRWGAISDVSADLWVLYQGEADRLLWFDGGRPVAAVDDAVAAIADAAAYGLSPDDYDAAALQVQWATLRHGQGSALERASFDVALSVAAARLVRAVHVGRVDPALLRWGYTGPRKAVDIPRLLAEVRGGQNLARLLRDLEPQFSHYRRARATLAIYRALAEAGEPPLVPALPAGTRKVLPGQAWTAIPHLASRLRAVGDLVGDEAGRTATYDAPLVEAVKRFQRRHGLEPDGVLGTGTLAALNVPLTARVRQIELAMERMRWLPDLSGAPNVFVNVATFRLWANDPRTREEPLRMNVVVGEALDHQTPMFLEQLEYIVFRPFWTPPRSILLDEILPRARRDAGYMARHRYEIVASGADEAAALAVTPENLEKVAAGRLTLRQRPGPSNSLGLAKFIFPNDENVYMHGTPSRGTFARARRDASHGCIRLEDPAALAAWVLRDQPDWTPARIAAAMNGDKPVRVTLRQPMTVVLFYDTVHVSRQNVVFFMTDIYGHDRRLDAALRQGYPYPASPRT